MFRSFFRKPIGTGTVFLDTSSFINFCRLVVVLLRLHYCKFGVTGID
jgi:hypothetical protein